MPYDSANRWDNAGKGDTPRKVDKEKFDENYIRLFGTKEPWYNNPDRFTKDSEQKETDDK